MERACCFGRVAAACLFGAMLAHSQPVVIERVTIPGNRELRLWMESPKKVDRGPLTLSNPYSCPEVTLGSYFVGKTRVSLMDTSKGELLNTVSIINPETSEDQFRIPFRIIAGRYYNVPGVRNDAEGKPRILTLKDINGDGKALEFVLFQQLACMGLQTALLGYSAQQDRVMQYPVELSFEGKTETQGWADYLCYQKPARPGVWSYDIDYRGRAGALVEYRVRYDASKERFIGTVRTRK